MLRTFVIFLAGALIGTAATVLADQDGWPWGPELDAVAAAPNSHRVLLENEHVRVLEVTIPPGEKEPPHTHQWPSVMISHTPARLRYYGATDKLVFETPEDRELSNELTADWMRPEGLHAVECIDDHGLRSIRVELKQLEQGAR